jgi:acyl-CoA synthetase (NDP forming)
MGGAPLALLERFGYSGDIYLVSRTRDDVRGRPCVGSIDDLPHGIDAAILAIPKAGVADAVESAGRRGMGGVIVFSSGYAELDESGEAAQSALASTATTYDLALAGPNCLGLVNFFEGIPLTFGDCAPNRRGDGPGLAIIAQSGAMSLALTYAAMAQDINVTYTISTGNESVLTIEDYLALILDEGRTRTVALLVEQIRRPMEFLQLARKARERSIGLCLLLTGRGVRAQAASLSHTGAISANQDVTRAILGREGVLFIDSLDELIETAGVLVKCPTPHARGVAFMTDSGAAKTYALDVSDDIGLFLPKLSSPTLAKLQSELPAFALASNPVDITAMGLNDPSLYARVASTLLGDEEVGCLIVSSMPGSDVQGSEQVQALLPTLVSSPKPVIYTIMGGESPLLPANRLQILDAGLPLFRSPERALRAAAHLMKHARVVHAANARAAPRRGIALGHGAREAFDERGAKILLSQAGVAIPDGDVVSDLEGARRVAARLGYPVVLKIASTSIAHKSDVGGVRVIEHESDLDTQFAAMRAQVALSYPDVSVESLLVEEYVTGGIEMLVGAARDAKWGAFVVVGLGGVWAEIVNDAVVIAGECDRDEIVDAVQSLRGFSVLEGARGDESYDIEALVDAVELIAGLLRESPDLAEVEVNPLLVHAEGKGVTALDALIVNRTY